MVLPITEGTKETRMRVNSTSVLQHIVPLYHYLKAVVTNGIHQVHVQNMRKRANICAICVWRIKSPAVWHPCTSDLLNLSKTENTIPLSVRCCWWCSLWSVHHSGVHYITTCYTYTAVLRITFRSLSMTHLRKPEVTSYTSPQQLHKTEMYYKSLVHVFRLSVD